MTVETITLTTRNPSLGQELIANEVIPGSFQDVWDCLKNARGIIEPAVRVAQETIVSIEHGASYEEAIAKAKAWEDHCNPGAVEPFLALTREDESNWFAPEMLSVTARLLENV